MKQLPFFIISSTPSLENIAFLKLFFLANSKKLYTYFLAKIGKNQLQERNQSTTTWGETTHAKGIESTYFTIFCISTLGLPPRGSFWKWSKWPWKMIHLMPCKNPRRLYIQLAFTYFVGPSSIMWSKLGLAPHFSTNESAWSTMVMGPQSRMWSDPKCHVTPSVCGN